MKPLPYYLLQSLSFFTLGVLVSASYGFSFRVSDLVYCLVTFGAVWGTYRALQEYDELN